ncbi:hypothetical protein D3C87_332710 [compost metagenome]
MPFASVIGLLLRPSILSFACLQKAVTITSPPKEAWIWPSLKEIAPPTLVSTVAYHTLKVRGTVGAP